MPTPMTIEMENEMTKDEIQAAKNNFNYADSNNLRMDDLGEKTKQTIRAALQSAQIKAETVDLEALKKQITDEIVEEYNITRKTK